MFTVEDSVKEKIKRAAKWEKENPGLSWCNPEHPQEEGKIFITKGLLESEAYRSLSRCALLIYQDFLAKREMILIKRNRKKVWVTNNNGEIVYPYAEAEKKGFSRKKFRNAIDELQQKGLIDIKHLGKGGKKPANGMGDVSKYWIDDRWTDYGTDQFRPPRNPRTKVTRTDRGWAVYNRNKKIYRCRKGHSLGPNGCRKGHSLEQYRQKRKNG
ncbi:hypothetical protein C6A37_07745 [Desulfobacteraceae bacterium SEEP-SAG9]|nr:hypothetical protein C6A37_07745 [Desulfobacteraceae bacterium SEEP-SAG9]